MRGNRGTSVVRRLGGRGSAGPAYRLHCAFITKAAAGLEQQRQARWLLLELKPSLVPWWDGSLADFLPRGACRGASPPSSLTGPRLPSNSGQLLVQAGGWPRRCGLWSLAALGLNPSFTPSLSTGIATVTSGVLELARECCLLDLRNFVNHWLNTAIIKN